MYIVLCTKAKQSDFIYQLYLLGYNCLYVYLENLIVFLIIVWQKSVYR